MTHWGDYAVSLVEWEVNKYTVANDRPELGEAAAWLADVLGVHHRTAYGYVEEIAVILSSAATPCGECFDAEKK